MHRYGTETIEPPDEVPRQFQHDAQLVVKDVIQKALSPQDRDPDFITIETILTMRWHVVEVWTSYDEAKREEMLSEALKSTPTVH